MTKCSNIMTKPVTTCAEDASVLQAAQMMKSDDVGSIPVVNKDDVLIGILTDRDIAINVVAARLDPNNCEVSRVMSQNMVVCRPDDDIETARTRMSEYQVRRLPIVDDSGHVVGIIAQADLVLRTNEDRKAEKVIEEISKPF